MNKTIITLLAAAILSGTAGISAAENTQTFTGKISHLKSSTGVNVTSSGSTTVKVTGPDEGVKLVKVDFDGSALSIYAKRGEGKTWTINGAKDLKGVTVTVTGPLISSFQATSSGDIKCTSNLNYGKGTLTLDTSSSGDIKFADVSCGTVNATTSSSGDIALGKLTCSEARLTTSSGDIDMETLKATTVTAKASSSGEIHITTINSDLLEASASSSAEIKLGGGTVKAANLSTSSSADIVARNVSFGNTNIQKSSGGSVKIGQK